MEKSSFKREVGYMFALGTNACRVLDSLGFDFDRSGAVESNTVSHSSSPAAKLFAKPTKFFVRLRHTMALRWRGCRILTLKYTLR